MHQLVGCLCVHCNQRIGSIIDGRFCPNCACPVHNKCAQPTLVPSDPLACTSCGAPASASARARELHQEAAQEESQLRGQPGKPGVIGLLFHLAVILVGLAILSIYLHHLLFGTTPEDELTLLEGVPQEVSLKVMSGRGGSESHFLRFSVSGTKTEYSSSQPKYKKVLEVIERRESVRVWVSTKRETVLPRNNWVPLYKLEHQNILILDYATTVANMRETGESVPICGLVVLALGGFGLFYYSRSRRKYQRWKRWMEKSQHA